jgi:hypothetical protein
MKDIIAEITRSFLKAINIPVPGSRFRFCLSISHSQPYGQRPDCQHERKLLLTNSNAGLLVVAQMST